MIAVLGSASWANGSTVDPVSRSFTVPSGTDRLLVVQSPLDATGVTYAGQVMTRAKNGAESSVKLDTWYLVNPPVGTANIVWTFGTPWTTGAYSAVVLSGADQAAPIHATLAQGNSYQSSPMTLTVAPPTGGSTLAFFHSSYASDPTVSGGDTDILFQVGDSRGLTAAMTAADDGTIAISGWAGQATCLMVGIALKPASPSGGTGTGTGSGSGGAATGGVGGSGSAAGGTGTGAGAGSGGAATGGSPSFTTDVLVNNTGTVLASTAIAWEWRQGGVIGAAPTSVTYGTGTTNGSGVLTITGIPAGAGELLARSTVGTAYYQAGTAA